MPKQKSYTVALTVNVTGDNGQKRTFTKQVENMVRPRIESLVEAGPFSGRTTKVEWTDTAKSVTIENEADTFDEKLLDDSWTEGGGAQTIAPAVKEKVAKPVQA